MAEAETEREYILEKAREIITKDRNSHYGTPEANFTMIAQLWTAYLNRDLEPHDVAAMMALMKIARVTTSPGQEDHWIDLAGYAACGGEVRPRA
jgi:hypothetical protein